MASLKQDLIENLRKMASAKVVMQSKALLKLPKELPSNIVGENSLLHYY